MEDASEQAAIVETLTSSLYDKDFYAWTQQQATLLRQGRVAKIDLPNILEEIESLGRTQLAELRSRYTVLALHLLKQMYQPEKAGRSWRTTILRQRIEIARHMKENPSRKSKADSVFADSYADARKLAASETGLKHRTFNPTHTLLRRGSSNIRVG